VVELLERAQVTPGHVALVVVAVFAARAFLGGIVRLVFGMVSLAVAAWLGYAVFLHGREWLAPLFGLEPGSEQVLYAAWGAGIAAYLTLGAAGRGLANRFAGDAKTLGPSRLAGAALSLVPSLFLLWVAYTALRASGAVSELAGADRLAGAADGEEVVIGGMFARAKRALDESRVGALVGKLDPFAPGDTTKLAQLLILAKDPEAWEQARQVPSAAAVLDHPAVGRLLRDNDVRSLVAHSNHTALLRRPELRQAALDPDLRRALAAVDPGEVARALTAKPPGFTRSPTRHATSSRDPKTRVVRSRPGPPGPTGSR
jgi:hypothetical protein